jgi:hypothetical protein
MDDARVELDLEEPQEEIFGGFKIVQFVTKAAHLDVPLGAGGSD